MRSLLSPLCLAVLVACGADDDGPSTQPDDTGSDSGLTSTGTASGTATAPTDATWWVDGQEGILVVVSQERGLGTPGLYGVHGMFADTLQGFGTAPWCQSGGPCIGDIPAAGEQTDGLGLVLDPAGSAWSWNGHDLSVGSLIVPFDYNPNSGLAWYDAASDSSADLSPIAVSFDGEWGPYAGEVVIPEPLIVETPSADISLDLSQGPVEFKWVPTGADDVFLRLTSTGFERVWHLEDDGSFILDPADIPVPIDLESRIRLGRWNIQTQDVNGNQLTTIGVWEQPYAPLVCEDADYPNVAVTAAGTMPQPNIDPASVAVSYQFVTQDDIIRDFWLDANVDGTNDPFSSMMTFTFYDAAGAYLCDIDYDLSGAISVPPPSPVGGGTILEAWEINLANGNSNCNSVDQAVWGTRDLRVVLQALQWGFGYGTIVDTVDEVSEDYDWGTYEPYLNGSYIKLGSDWYEVGAAGTVGMQSCGVVDPAVLLLPKPEVSPLPTRLYLGIPYLTFSL